jgi:carbonic anhydrase
MFYSINQRTVSAVVVHCGDPRFQTAFRKFIRKVLRLREGEYFPLVNAGGPVTMLQFAQTDASFAATKQQLRFILSHFHGITKVVLIGHQDCGWYKTFAKECHQYQEWEYLEDSQDNIQGTMERHVEIECWFASLNGHKVTFTKPDDLPLRT